MKRRFILVHYHIFKNAGTTIAWILERNFGNAFDAIKADGEKGVIPNSELVRFVRRNRQIAAVSSHHFRLPALKHERFRLLELCLLRHPLDRLRSMYDYYRRLENPADLSAVKARGLSMPDFLAWLRENQLYNLANVQTCILGNSGRYFFPPALGTWSGRSLPCRSWRSWGWSSVLTTAW